MGFLRDSNPPFFGGSLSWRRVDFGFLMFTEILARNKVLSKRSGSSRLKIGIVVPYYMHRFGGVQTLVRMLRDELVGRDHEVVIIAPRPWATANRQATPPGVALFGVSAEVNFKVPFHTTLPLATASREAITKFLDDQKFDVLNIHEPWMPPFAYQIVKEAQCPIVGTTHARWPRSIINQSLEKARKRYFYQVLQKLDQITAVSTVAARNVTDVDPDWPVSIIPNAIDLADWRRRIKLAKRPSEPYILYLNRLEKRKGPAHLLAAYRVYLDRFKADPPVRLVIAGNGPQRQALEVLARELKIAPKVQFLGSVSEDRKFELLANASLYVSPAPYGESFGIVLLEAMAADLPIVAGNNEGYRTVMRGPGQRSLVDPTDRRAFSDRIHLLVSDPKARKNWQGWAKKTVGSYDKRVVADRYEEAFWAAVSSGVVAKK